MNIEQTRRTGARGRELALPGEFGETAQLVLLFRSTSLLKERQYLAEITGAYPKAHLLGCSTSGEICDTQVLDDSMVVTAVSFEHTRFQGGALVKISDLGSSFVTGERLGRSLDKDEWYTSSCFQTDFTSTGASCGRRADETFTQPNSSQIARQKPT